jgi:uncharacterized protein YfdQ (DUF2303 family)
MDVQNEALDNQADSTAEVDYTSEDSVNAAAAKEVEARASVEQSSKTEVKKPDVATPQRLNKVRPLKNSLKDKWHLMLKKVSQTFRSN